MRAVIVDHEPSARLELMQLCEQAGIEVVAQADCGASGIEVIRAHGPDLVLLEAELQDMSGFEVLRASKVYRQDVMAIMVTAQPQQSLPAFECRTIDLLSKPIERERFLSSISRVRRWLGSARSESQDNGNGSSLSRRANASVEMCLIAEKARRLHFLEPTAVDYIRSDGNYLTMHLGAERYVSRNTLKHVAAMLAPFGFMRIDRSLLINLRKVAFVERFEHRSEVAFVLHTGEQLPCGKMYRKQILRDLRRGHLAFSGPISG